MADLSESDAALVDAETTRKLLSLLVERFRGARDPAAVDAEIVRIEELARQPYLRSFRESVADAICLYFSRAATTADAAGPEFEPLLRVVDRLQVQRLQRDLMDWVDRHLGDRPTQDGERRFAMAVWTLMRIAHVDSASFMNWWMERAEKHRGGWAESHMKSDAISRL